MRRYLIVVVPLCAAIVGAPMPGESANKPRSIAACNAALAKKGVKAANPSAVSAEFGKGMWMTVKGKAEIAGGAGAQFICRTHHNSVISLEIVH